MVRTGLAQVAWTGDRRTQLDRLEHSVAEAARAGVRLLAFPELCTSPYFCTTTGQDCEDCFESIPDGPAVRRMSLLAQRSGLVLVLPLAEQDDRGRRYNSAVVIDADGSLAGSYRKRHLPHREGNWERAYFRPGLPGPAVFATAAGRIGVALCWDRFYAGTWQRLAAERAQITVVPVASAMPPGHPQATMVQPAAALRHSMFVATVNRVDRDTFTGGSYVAGPRGELLGEFGPGREELVIRELDLDRTGAPDGQSEQPGQITGG